MRFFGNMQIELPNDVTCHCGHVFKVRIHMDGDKPMNTDDDGIVLTKSGLQVSCPKCLCKWQRQEAKLPELPQQWKFFRLFVRVKDDPDGEEVAFGMQHAIDYFDAVSKLVLPMLHNCHLDKLESYRLQEISKDEYLDHRDRIEGEAHQNIINFFRGL